MLQYLQMHVDHALGNGQDRLIQKMLQRIALYILLIGILQSEQMAILIHMHLSLHPKL